MGSCLIIPFIKKRRQRVREVQLTATGDQVEESSPISKPRLLVTGLPCSAPEARNGDRHCWSEQTWAESWAWGEGDRMESIRGPWVPGQASSCSQKGTGIHNQDRRNMAVQGVGAVRHLKGQTREFPGDLVVKTWHFHHCGPSSVPGLGIEIPYQTAAYRSQKKKKNSRAKLNINLPPLTPYLKPSLAPHCS